MGFGVGLGIIGGSMARPFSFFFCLVTLSFVWTLPFFAGVFVALPSDACLGIGGLMGVFEVVLDTGLGMVFGRLGAEVELGASSLLISLRDFGIGV